MGSHRGSNPRPPTLAVDALTTEHPTATQHSLSLRNKLNMKGKAGVTSTCTESPTLVNTWLWLPQVNGEAIYSSRPWRAQNDTATKQTWYTTSKNGTFVYAITFETLTPGTDVVLKQPKTTPSTEIYLLGFTGGPLSFNAASDGVHIKLPDIMFDTLKYAWTFKMTAVEWS